MSQYVDKGANANEGANASISWGCSLPGAIRYLIMLMHTFFHVFSSGVRRIGATAPLVTEMSRY